MALYSIDNTERKISHIPHQARFDAWCSRLTPDQLQAIRTELQRRIEGDEVHTSSWIPGRDWAGTVWRPIYTDACHHNRDAAGRCFGLFVWEAFMKHPEDWSFGQYRANEIEPRGMTYFRIHI